MATTTAASGTRPEVRHLMLKNRSAPMSDAEAGLGDQVLPGMDADEVGHDRRVAVGDVAEGSGVDEHRACSPGSGAGWA